MDRSSGEAGSCRPRGEVRVVLETSSQEHVSVMQIHGGAGRWTPGRVERVL